MADKQTPFETIFVYQKITDGPTDVFTEIKLTGVPEDWPKPRRIKFLRLPESGEDLDREVLFKSWAQEEGSVTRTFQDGSVLFVTEGGKITLTEADGQVSDWETAELTPDHRDRIQTLLTEILPPSDREEEPDA